MNAKKVRDIFRLINACCFSIFYIPHLLIYVSKKMIKHLLIEIWREWNINPDSQICPNG